MERSDRTDPVFRVGEDRGYILIVYTCRLNAEKARDHLQVVLDPMMNFLQKCVLLGQRLPELLLGLHALGLIPQHLCVPAEVSFIVPDGSRNPARE